MKKTRCERFLGGSAVLQRLFGREKKLMSVKNRPFEQYRLFGPSRLQERTDQRLLGLEIMFAIPASNYRVYSAAYTKHPISRKRLEQRLKFVAVCWNAGIKIGI